MKCFSRLATVVIVLWPLDELWIRLNVFCEARGSRWGALYIRVAIIPRLLDESFRYRCVHAFLSFTDAFLCHKEHAKKVMLDHLSACVFSHTDL